jgi:hypothetical protein
MQEVEMQTALLAAGVLTVNEVRGMRGLAPLPDPGADLALKDGAVKDGAAKNVAVKKEDNVTTTITNRGIQA